MFQPNAASSSVDASNEDASNMIKTAIALCEQRKIGEAENLINKGLLTFPVHPQLLWCSAFIAELRRDWTETLSRCERLLSHFPDSARGLEGRVTALRELRRFDEAEQALVMAHERVVDSIRLDVEAARLAAARSDWNAAIAAWEYVGTRNPNSPEAVIQINDILIRQDKLNEAEALLEAYLKRFPESFELAMRYCSIPVRRRYFPEALLRWKQLDNRFPDNARVLGGLAETLWMMTDNAALIPVLDRILHINPHDVTAEILYAKLEMRSNLAADAVRRLETAEKCWPGNKALLSQLSDARMQYLLDNDNEAELDKRRRDAKENDQAYNDVIFDHFESLGDGCEFGLLQRRFGSEPLGLLRWANITPIGLISGLEERFARCGNLETMQVRIDPAQEYRLIDLSYEMEMHTFISTHLEKSEILLPKLAKRQRYLSRMLIEALEDGQRIFVYKAVKHFESNDVFRLWRAVCKFGKNSLLIVRIADSEHNAGTIEVVEDGLMFGYISHFSPTNIAVEDWKKVCISAQKFHLNRILA